MDFPHARAIENNEVPVIDLSRMNGTLEERKQIADKIAHAAKTSGFFYLVNHGMEVEQITHTLDVAKRFFELPTDTKMNVALVKSDNYRGYLPFKMMGKDPTLKGNLHEAFQMHRELPVDDPDVQAGKPLHGPNMWPEEMPELKEAMSAYWQKMTDISYGILRLFAMGLDLEEDAFMHLFERPMNQFRVMHYPPQEPTDTSGGHVGVRPHTDSGAFTLLYQDEVGGLEILSQDGDWVMIPHVPGSFVVNIGEMMKVWTDGIFAATPHRVINRFGKERYSMPFFATPDYDAVILPMMTNPSPSDHPSFATSVDRSKPTTSGEILHRVYSRIWPTTTVQRSDAG